MPPRCAADCFKLAFFGGRGRSAMARDEDAAVAGSPQQRRDAAQGDGGGGGGGGGGAAEGAMKSAGAAPDSPSAPAQRLAHAHSVIAHLQQNLATQLKPSTVEALRSGPAPPAHRNGLAGTYSRVQ
ncbi:Protein of unknown function [Gryllus bimaculatus]|nr:Protein of unknown function [Gryllus bimaculatus]